MVSKKVVFCIYNLALSFMIRRSGLCTRTQQEEDVVYTLYLSDNLGLTFLKEEPISPILTKDKACLKKTSRQGGQDCQIWINTRNKKVGAYNLPYSSAMPVVAIRYVCAYDKHPLAGRDIQSDVLSFCGSCNQFPHYATKPWDTTYNILGILLTIPFKDQQPMFELADV